MKKRVLKHIRKDWKTYVLLALILALAAGLRFTGIDWDRGAQLHPDERFLAMVTTDIKWPGNVTEYFSTSTSPLNPANKGKTFFVYGTFPVFLTKLIGDLTGNGHYTAYTLIGRRLSAIFDILTILAVFLIAKNLFDKKTALLSAFFLAVTVVHIQHSHFSVVDLFATFFVVLSFYFLILYVKTQKIRYAALLGASMGFGLASKINASLLAPIIALGLLIVFINLIRNNLKSKHKLFKAIFLSARTVILAGIFIVIIAGIIFRILQPYAFAGPLNLSFSDSFIHSMQEVARLTSKESGSGYVPSFQWIDRPVYFLLKNLTLWGIGIPLSIICWLGLLYSIYRLIFKKDYRLFLMVTWVVFILTYQSLKFVKTQRYVLPAIPFLMILGAFFIVSIIQSHEKLKNKRARYFCNTIITIVVISCLIWPLAFMQIYINTHPRIAASIWIHENIPANSTNTMEPWDDAIPFYLDFMPPRRDYKTISLELFGADDDKKMTKLSKQLSGVDYVFITSGRNYKVLPRLGNLPYITRYYELLFNEELGFQLEKTFTNYPSIFGIEINDDESEEQITVYDHPKVLIFKNTERLSSEEIFNRITGT